ncbi:MAG: hypothetical protein PGN16_16150 [Sphingomonas phyllosphaerae]|uniref:hypothetical protein n=1 Tax=Sphingomonas phyllosphaerae TaxID=257003 RepID=UPI002FF925DD
MTSGGHAGTQRQEILEPPVGDGGDGKAGRRDPAAVGGWGRDVDTGQGQRDDHHQRSDLYRARQAATGDDTIHAVPADRAGCVVHRHRSVH